MSYVWLDTLLWWLHVLVIGFNLLGWIWNSTRRLHLVIVLLTIVSWLILGFWYGFGYCFLTDWHWEIKRELGEADLPSSFITYLLNKQLGWSIPAAIVDWVTALAFGSVFIASCYKNRDLIQKRSIRF